MASRLKLHEELCTVLGTRNVYFQSPGKLGMKYPCIKYSHSGVRSDRANDKIYKNVDRYEIIVIDTNPDSEIYKKILEHFQMCSYDRGYTADNLNHDVLTLYY